MGTQIPNQITGIKPGSIAEEIEIKVGDVLISINGNTVHDILDYKFHLSDEWIELEIEREGDERYIYEIEKDYDEDLGLEFSNPLIEDAKSCRNKCIFCFIDQLPKGMRDSLYFKDDDSRLSFLQGNFVTLTNLSDEEIDRIIAFRLSPIKISVHTTDPELRLKMLKNPNAKKINEQLKKLYDASLEMHAQIVLVPDVNDGAHLEKTVTDLAKLHPHMESIAVVPVGITKYRDGLEKVTPFDAARSKTVIEQVQRLQEKMCKEIGTRFVFLSDEFYALSKTPLPTEAEYEGYPQLENGVGLLSSFRQEIEEELAKAVPTKRSGSVAIVTGTLASSYLQEIAQKIQPFTPNLMIDIIPIENNFFGGGVTVSGLVTGGDILSQFAQAQKYDTIYLPDSMLRAQSDVFLDDVCLPDLQEKFQRNVVALPVSGAAFVRAIWGG